MGTLESKASLFLWRLEMRNMRTERLVILLSERERKVVGKLAEVERLPTSTLARRMLLSAAERRGVVVPPVQRTDQEARRWPI